MFSHYPRFLTIILTITGYFSFSTVGISQENRNNAEQLFNLNISGGMELSIINSSNDIAANYGPCLQTSFNYHSPKQINIGIGASLMGGSLYNDRSVMLGFNKLFGHHAITGQIGINNAFQTSSYLTSMKNKPGEFVSVGYQYAKNIIQFNVEYVHKGFRTLIQDISPAYSVRTITNGIRVRVGVVL